MQSISQEKVIAHKISEIDRIAEDIPGVIIIHNIETTEVVYMSPRGLRLLGTTMEELKSLGADYHKKYFNQLESEEYVPKIFGLLERNIKGEVLTFFQQVNLIGEGCWKWHSSAVKILLWNEDGSPLLIITVATPLEPTDNLSIKADRLLKENEFLRKNQQRFNLLTRQERRILEQLARGRSSSEIANELYISVHTADTHRRNIKRKLQITNLPDLIEYAKAFNLI